MRGKGEGSIFKDTHSGLWTAIVELPPRDGKRRRKTIRRKLKKDVVEELARLKSDLKSRGDLPTSTQTVEQWFSYWLREIAAKEVRPKTLDGYRASTAHIIAAIGSVKLDKVSAAHIRRVHDHITESRGLSPTTALLAHRVMAVSFKIAMREGRIGRNPAELTNAPRKAVAKLDVLSMPEAKKVLQTALDDHYKARWFTSFLTGARRAEVIGLERDRVGETVDLSWQLMRLKLTDETGKPEVPNDYEYRHLTGGLYLTRPKSSHGWRMIPLVGPLRVVLEQHLAATPDNEWGLVFVTPSGQPIDPDRDSKNWIDLRKRAGIFRDVRLHDVRHSHIDFLYAFGVPEDVIMRHAGHSRVSMTRAYQSGADDTRYRAALEQFSNQFSRLVDGRSETLAIDD